MKRLAFVLFMLVSINSVHGAGVDYAGFVAYVSRACWNPSYFNESFTNDVTRFKMSHTNLFDVATADLAQSLYYWHQYEDMCDQNAFIMHQNQVSNILESVSAPVGGWVRQAAAFQYACGLNADGKYEDSYRVVTNAIREVSAYGISAGDRTFWNEMSSSPGETSLSVLETLRVMAALEMSRRGNYEGIETHTNGLSAAAYQVFCEENE